MHYALPLGLNVTKNSDRLHSTAHGFERKHWAKEGIKALTLNILERFRLEHCLLW